MPRLHALELLPDAAGEATIRDDWQALRDAGLPSMLDHRGGTNTPHVTVISVPAIDGALERVAADSIASLLPLSVSTAGIAVLGGALITLVRLVAPSDDLVGQVMPLRAATTGHPHPGWTPHVTLARRLPRDAVQRALDVLAPRTDALVLTTLRRWDPDTGTVRTLGSR
ncbi:2'-5' RNA ligase family protein [Aeromicrobium sp. CF3.5]|uniref:2'-5' RNA ligase family protein n=1 Tax=Aeromicrobium sp. CF3.5 TaxID=3373078 RepID=UPI003EE530A3